MRWVVVAAALVLSVGVSLCGIAQAEGTRGTRRPLFVEVKKDSITLLPNGDDYLDLFGDANPRQIPLADIDKNQDLEKLLNYVLSHKAPNGLLRGRRDTFVTLLIRPDAVNAYRAVAREVDQFEKTNEKKLVVAILPNGARVLDSLTGKAPLPGEGYTDTWEIWPQTARDVPRDGQTGRPLLQQRTVLVKDGKVFLFVDPEKKLETAVKDRIEEIIESNDIQVGEANYITDADQAQKLIDKFNDGPVKNNFFETRLLRMGNSINLEIMPTAAWGEKPEDAVRGNFRKYLWGNQGKWYLRYLVEADPDSFEAYMAIRKVTDSEGFFAGWQPIDPGSYNSISGSGYRIGVKPPPRPANNQNRKPGPIKGVVD